MTYVACEVCQRPLIYGACPECEPSKFLDALFALETSPLHFISAAHYGAWMRRSPLRVDGLRPRINGRYKAIVFRQHGHRCLHCGSTTLLTFGHRMPWSCGGNDQPGNGVPECPSCNGRQYPPLAAYMAQRVAA